MKAESLRLSLLQQHQRMRDHLQNCTRLAELYRAGERVVARDLDAALDALRDELSIHNEVETAAIQEILQGTSEWSSLMIDRMLEEHVGEHAAFWETLSGPWGEVAGRIDDLADELDAHMAAEERTFLAPGTLRDDVIRARAHDFAVRTRS
jgi:iron-sulfur cluster repair protein YtfE (RIC family)